MIKRLLHEFRIMAAADDIILDYMDLKAENGRVNLHYFKANGKCDSEFNLGDYLSKVVVEWMLNKKNLSLSTKINGKKHLYSIGSILLMGYQNATVWGTGFPFEPSRYRGGHWKLFQKLDVRCVRGPFTKKMMEKLGHSCPEIYGDPAVLMPLIYQPEKVKKTLEYLVIPHFSTQSILSKKIPPENILNMNTADYKGAITKISSARKVFSSSLHGIILAESYGVPAVFYQDRAERFNYKYADWYESTGRVQYDLHRDLESAMTMSEYMIPDFTAMREQLLMTFPYDLWE